MPGPFVYAHAELLVGSAHVSDIAGEETGQCVSLVKRYIQLLQNVSSQTWKKGVNVIETLKNGGTIAKGTAIATFTGERFMSRHGHAAFYLGHESYPDGSIRIYVVEQYLRSDGVQKRLLQNRGKDSSGDYIDRSNNGEAFSVILL
ncbi:hypothetical protein AGMMS49545_19290 [Betaproteobacteria bacterium]|nr:hypothetical protein AGMMS49545_19290 [Betaproteobacteria bacterium]GHU48155.1 hypothetical protein AGMMS50289_24400 [Betaproteobacteria bacterium]